MNPKNASAHSNLGRTLALRGRFAEAEAHFATALQIKPSDVETQVSYATALAQQGKINDAVKQLRMGTHARHEIGPALLLATLLYQTGQSAEAAGLYRQVLAVEPKHQEALNNLAWILATSPNPAARNGQDAIRFAEQSCRLTSFTNATAIGTLAAAYAEAGRFTNAVAMASRAVQVAAASGDSRFAAINQQLLNMYRAGVPYREPR